MNKLLITISFNIVFCLSGFPQQNTIAFTHANIYTINTDSLLNDYTLIIQNGIITDLFPTGSKKLPENTQEINIDRRYILPGLIDGHAHLSANQNREMDLQAMLSSGITSIRDMGGNAMVYKNLRNKSEAGELQIPNIYYSANLFGPEFFKVDPRVKFAAGPYEPGKSPWMRLIEADTDFKEVISDAKKAGVTAIKLYSSLTPQQISAITKEAHGQGLQVYGHATIFPSKPSDLVKALPDGISHALSIAFEVYDDIPGEFNEAILKWLPQKDLSQIDENDYRIISIFQTMKENDIIFEPTISAWKSPEQAEKPIGKPVNSNIAHARKALNEEAIHDLNDRITKTAIEQGVKISAGTDQTFNMKWVQDEIIFLTELGMTPLDAIRATTLTNAEVLGMEDHLGSIEVGKRADLLIINEDPVKDIRNIRDVYQVIKDGEII